MENGIVVPKDWWAIVFNPSFPYRFSHMAIAAFLVVGTAAWHLFKGKRDEWVKKSFSYGLWMVLATSVSQAVVGDMHGLNTLEHQPTKLAAIEGHWNTNHDHGMSLLLFAIPDMENEKNHFEIGIPNLGSLILKHSLDGKVIGLKKFASEDRPNALVAFWSLRVMVGFGVLMILLSLAGLYLRKQNRLFESKKFHLASILLSPSGYIALLAGWVTTEVGRQPWSVYGVLRTEVALSHTVSTDQIGITLIIFVVTYAIIFGCGIYYMIRQLLRGAEQH